MRKGGERGVVLGGNWGALVRGMGCGIQWLGEADQIELCKSGTA